MLENISSNIGRGGSIINILPTSSQWTEIDTYKKINSLLYHIPDKKLEKNRPTHWDSGIHQCKKAAENSCDYDDNVSHDPAIPADYNKKLRKETTVSNLKVKIFQPFPSTLRQHCLLYTITGITCTECYIH